MEPGLTGFVVACGSLVGASRFAVRLWSRRSLYDGSLWIVCIDDARAFGGWPCIDGWLSIVAKADWRSVSFASCILAFRKVSERVVDRTEGSVSLLTERNWKSF